MKDKMRKFRLSLLIFSTILLINACKKEEKVFDARVTVRTTSYKPYDIKFFYDEVKKVGKGYEEAKYSPKTGTFLTTKNVDSMYTYFVVSPQFYPTSREINHIKTYAGRGNNVFISSFSFSDEFIDSLYFRGNKTSQMPHYFPPIMYNKNLEVMWKDYDLQIPFKYTGQSPITAKLNEFNLYSGNAIKSVDTLITRSDGDIQLVRFECGYGNIYVSNNPILLSNYFLLQKKNYKFFNLLSDKLNLENSYILWDDYFRKVYSIPTAEGSDNSNDFESSNNTNEEVGDTSFFKIINENRSLKWAFYTFLVGIALFFLNFFRRIQKPIPIQQSLKNNSEAYINVVGGLYWQQQNHKSIAEKIISQFFEYLSNSFHLQSKDFLEGDLNKISQKTGRRIGVLKDIQNSIQFIRTNDEIEQQNLINLYQKVNDFYNN